MPRRFLASRTAPAAWIAAVAALAVAGLVVGAPLKITKGVAERGAGTYVGFTTTASYWTFVKLANGVVAAGAGAASTANATPTILPGNATSDLTLGGAASGATAIIWTFTLAAGAPAKTELRLTFNLSFPAGTTVLIVYLETPITSPTSAETVRLYDAPGSVTPTVATITSLTVATHACPSIGGC